MLERAKFRILHSPLRKASKKQTKTKEDQGGKQIDGTMNQNEQLVGWINNDGRNLSYKEIFQKCFKERFNEVIITHEIFFDELKYFFWHEGYTKRFDNFDNRTNLFEQIKSCDMQLEEEKNIKNCLHTKSFSNCIYFMNVLIRKICRINCDCILKKNWGT